MFNNQDNVLWPNQFVNVRLLLADEPWKHRGSLRVNPDRAAGQLRLRRQT